MNNPRSDVPSGLADGLVPPYFAVIFTSQRSQNDEGYEASAARMVELAAQQPGFLGVESARGEDGLGITVSYWRSLEAIHAWRDHAEHRIARERGRADWYTGYELRISRVERAYAWPAGVRPGAPA